MGNGRCYIIYCDIYYCRSILCVAVFERKEWIGLLWIGMGSDKKRNMRVNIIIRCKVCRLYYPIKCLHLIFQDIFHAMPNPW